jgi:hypothetical protein
MLWKETGGNVNWLRGLYALCRPGVGVFLGAAFAVVLLIHICVALLRPLDERGIGAVNAMVRGLGVPAFCLGLLIIALSAAGRVSKEREQQTLDGLRTTPLGALDILLPKWLASIWSIRPLALFLAAIWGFGLLFTGLHAAALPLLLAASVVYIAFFGTVGLWFSMLYRTTMRATLFTVLAAIVLIPGPGLLGKVFFADLPRGSRPAPAQVWDERLVMQTFSPALTMWALTFHPNDQLGDPERLPMVEVIAAVLGLHFYLLITVILWASLLARFEAEKGPPPRPDLKR